MSKTTYADVKITVLKRLEVPEIVAEYAAEGTPPVCGRYREGQAFLSQRCNMPSGFCSWAWAELQSKVVYLSLGNDYPWMRQKGTEIFCCSDGLHPVLYKLERVVPT